MLAVQSNTARRSKRATKMSQALLGGFYYPTHGRSNVLSRVKPAKFLIRGVSENGPYFTFELENGKTRSYSLGKIVMRLG